LKSLNRSFSSENNSITGNIGCGGVKTMSSERSDKGPQRKVWGFDSEFMMSGRAGHPEDVHTIQFSDGEEAYVAESASELKAWLNNHHNVKTLYGFVVLPDLGSVSEWLTPSAVSIKKRGTQTTGWMKYGKAKIHVVDAQPMLSSFGLRRLADCGSMIGYPKLAKPEWLGQRAWQGEAEHASFLEYAKADAIITSRIVRWLIEKYGADPALYVSAGTIAAHEFEFPRRLKQIKGRVLMSPFESLVKLFTFAGRSEGFITGYTQNAIYNDVASLYPISIVATRALQIKSAVPCDFQDLALSDNLSEKHFGWIEGTFRTKHDMWGLPVRGFRNYYVTGTVTGLYNTFDIAASKAEILNATRCYKPIFRENIAEHDKYADLLMKKLEGKFGSEEKGYYKALLNSVSGKLGQAHPISERSNFLAYNILLGHSHLIMSKLFDKCNSPIIAMDTDSIFSTMDMSGKWFELSDGDRTFPVRMDIKGRGNLAFFRSKRYIMTGELSCFGSHGWRYFLEDYLKLFNGELTELDTRIDIKHTLLTRQREALRMAKGRWRTRPEHLDLEKIKLLLTADDKRKRANSDSYGLVMQKKNAPSQAWNHDEYMIGPDDHLGLGSHKLYFRSAEQVLNSMLYSKRWR
jgi:hypothetical protein